MGEKVKLVDKCLKLASNIDGTREIEGFEIRASKHGDEYAEVDLRYKGNLVFHAEHTPRNKRRDDYVHTTVYDKDHGWMEKFFDLQ